MSSAPPFPLLPHRRDDPWATSPARGLAPVGFERGSL
jgi:hypothetical protein